MTVPEWRRDPQNLAGDPGKYNDGGDPCLNTMLLLMICPALAFARAAYRSHRKGRR